MNNMQRLEFVNKLKSPYLDINKDRDKLTLLFQWDIGIEKVAIYKKS